jgi:serine/threonine protein kinase
MGGVSWDEASSKVLFLQLVLGVDYCHRRGITNRDMKLQNTLLKRDTAPHHAAPQVSNVTAIQRGPLMSDTRMYQTLDVSHHP